MSITVLEFDVYRLGDENRRFGPAHFSGGEVGTEIENMGTSKPWSELAGYSGTLVDQSILFEIGMMRELGLDPLQKEEVLIASTTFYRVCNILGHRGNATNDACDYIHGKKLHKAKESDRSVRWVTNPLGFENDQILGGQDHYILLPADGWVKRTMDGLYRPDTGTPFETTPNKEEAVESLAELLAKTKNISIEAARSLAQRDVSYFWGRSEGSEASAVVRCSVNGPFGICVDNALSFRDKDLGSFRISGSRSEAVTD
jgi:hypothetical protein